MSGSLDRSEVVRQVLRSRDSGLRPNELIEQIVRQTKSYGTKRAEQIDQAARTIRRMLNKGEIGFGPDMSLSLSKQ